MPPERFLRNKIGRRPMEEAEFSQAKKSKPDFNCLFGISNPSATLTFHAYPSFTIPKKNGNGNSAQVSPEFTSPLLQRSMEKQPPLKFQTRRPSNDEERHRERDKVEVGIPHEAQRSGSDTLNSMKDVSLKEKRPLEGRGKRLFLDKDDPGSSDNDDDVSILAPSNHSGFEISDGITSSPPSSRCSGVSRGCSESGLTTASGESDSAMKDNDKGCDYDSDCLVLDEPTAGDLETSPTTAELITDFIQPVSRNVMPSFDNRSGYDDDDDDDSEEDQDILIIGLTKEEMEEFR